MRFEYDWPVIFFLSCVVFLLLMYIYYGFRTAIALIVFPIIPVVSYLLARWVDRYD